MSTPEEHFNLLVERGIPSEIANVLVLHKLAIEVLMARCNRLEERLGPEK